MMEEAYKQIDFYEEIDSESDENKEEEDKNNEDNGETE